MNLVELQSKDPFLSLKFGVPSLAWAVLSSTPVPKILLRTKFSTWNGGLRAMSSSVEGHSEVFSLQISDFTLGLYIFWLCFHLMFFDCLFI